MFSVSATKHEFTFLPISFLDFVIVAISPTLCLSCFCWLNLIDFIGGVGYRCSTYQSGSLTDPDQAVDGIFGFGPGELSVISQLSSRAITPKVFSHCLKGDGNGGGILVLGEILEPGIIYSPLVPSQYVLFPRKLSFHFQCSFLRHSGYICMKWELLETRHVGY
jgi:hypothetical protein